MAALKVGMTSTVAPRKSKKSVPRAVRVESADTTSERRPWRGPSLCPGGRIPRAWPPKEPFRRPVGGNGWWEAIMVGNVLARDGPPAHHLKSILRAHSASARLAH